MRRTQFSRPLSAALGVLLAAAGAAALPVTVVVTSTTDVVTSCATTGMPAIGTGGCTLRDAISYSDANPPVPPAQNLIQFNIPGSGSQVIDVHSDLPPITAGVVVDGFSQPGASPNTLPVGSDAVRPIFVRGGNTIRNLFVISGGAGSVIRGLEMTVLDNGVSDLLTQVAMTLDSCCNSVTGNYIGLNPTGTGFYGYGCVDVHSARNAIGGPSPSDRNVIGFSYDCTVRLSGEQNSVQGNYIGVDEAGTGALGGFATGIQVESPSNTIVGNVISGDTAGVVVDSDDNIVSANRIGTDATGTVALGNEFEGIVVNGSGNVVGTSNSTNPILGFLFQGNEIAFNGTALGASGIRVGAGAVNNSLLSNAVFSNAALGIDLDGDGVTANDLGDGDEGPNHFQNYPVLASASNVLLQTHVTGALNSAAHTRYRVQFFSNDACDASGYGQGQTFVDEIFVKTDGSGNAAVHDAIFPRVPVDQYITSTATDPLGNTSELSQCVQVTGTPPPPPPWKILIRFLEEGPIRVAPGVPVELPFGVEARQQAPRAPAGVVTLSDEAGHECEAALIRSGVGACALTFPSEGTYRVRAHYSANGDFLEGESEALTIRVKSGGG